MHCAAFEFFECFPNFFVTFCDVICYIFDSVHFCFTAFGICLLFMPIPHFKH